MVERATGQRLRFYLHPTDFSTQKDPDIVESLTVLTDGQGIVTGYEVVDGHDTVETYDADGRLVSLTRRDGLAQTLAYHPITQALAPKPWKRSPTPKAEPLLSLISTAVSTP